MLKKALLLSAVLLTCACAGPSLRDRNAINSLILEQAYARAEHKIEKTKNKFGEKNAVMYYLNLGLVQHDALQPEKSAQSFAAAENFMDEYYAKSVSRAAATLLFNDNTTPYYAPPYEMALTFFYRAMDYLDLDDLQSALVEARKAVFYLDNLRQNKKDGYRDDAFVQYFASLLFESEGNTSSARIARANAFNAYGSAAPDFPVPQEAHEMGEIIFIHYNGLAPQKYSKTIQFAWNDAVLALNETDELNNAEPSVQNAIMGGFIGNAVTLAYPALEDSYYEVRASDIEVAGIKNATQAVSNVAALAHENLEETLAAQRARMIARAVLKQVSAELAKHAVHKATDDENLGMLAGMVWSAFNAATETADTRSWFTLPAEIRMSRIFVPPGVHTLYFTAEDAEGNILEAKVFEDVEVKKGGRVFLHTRTTK